jgi:hypothetical protein
VVVDALQYATLGLAPGEFMMLRDWCSHPSVSKRARPSVVSRPTSTLNAGRTKGRIAALATPWTPPDARTFVSRCIGAGGVRSGGALYCVFRNCSISFLG